MTWACRQLDAQGGGSWGAVMGRTAGGAIWQIAGGQIGASSTALEQTARICPSTQAQEQAASAGVAAAASHNAALIAAPATSDAKASRIWPSRNCVSNTAASGRADLAKTVMVLLPQRFPGFSDPAYFPEERIRTKKELESQNKS